MHTLSEKTSLLFEKPKHLAGSPASQDDLYVSVHYAKDRERARFSRL